MIKTSESIRSKHFVFVRHDVIVIFMKVVIFWDVATFSECVNRRFGGTYLFHIQGRKSAVPEMGVQQTTLYGARTQKIATLTLYLPRLCCVSLTVAFHKTTQLCQ
jgi:hypothetical protein